MVREGSSVLSCDRPSGAEIRPHLRRLVRAIRINWPNIRILLRGDSHVWMYMDPARLQQVGWIRIVGHNC